jgi:NADPH:quinone reductase-like Zn-dependent oxidoreductase
MMKAVSIHDHRQTLRLEDAPVSEVGPDEVLIRVSAAALNPLDGRLQAGDKARFFPLTFSYTLGTDLSGTVEQVDTQVGRWHPGDQVTARPNPASGGAFAEYVAVSQGFCMARPASMTLTDAAGLPTAAGTVWKALFVDAGLRAGQTVLIHAGAGGVGSFAVQFSHSTGAHVIATVSGDGIDQVRALGADRVIDRQAEDFADILSDLDVVFDTVGGATQAKSFGVLRPGGHLVSSVTPLDETLVQERGVSAGMVFLSPFFSPDVRGLQIVVDEVQNRSVKVLVDRVLPLAQFGEAFDRQVSGRARGKIILTLESAAGNVPGADAWQEWPGVQRLWIDHV